MAVTSDDVRAVAELARLELSAEEVEALAGDLNRILEHVDALANAEIGGPGVGAAGAEARDARLPSTALDADSPGADPLEHGPDQFAPAFVERHFAVPRLASHDDPGGAGG